MSSRSVCSVDELNKGKWTEMEDKKLVEYVEAHGEGKWPKVQKAAGLKRCGKSCRLRWLNYLKPELKRGKMSQDEEDLIIRLHKLLGNRWSLIAGRIPGRTDNDVKNYWNTNLSKKFGSLNKNDIKKFLLQPPSILTTESQQSHQAPIIQTAGDRLNSRDMMTTNNCSSKPHNSRYDDWSWTFDDILLAMDFNNIGDFVFPAGESQDQNQSTSNFQSFASLLIDPITVAEEDWLLDGDGDGDGVAQVAADIGF